MTTARRPGIRIRPTRPEEARAAATVIARAFEPLEMTRWLVPDDPDRIPIMTGFLHLTVEQAIAHGTVDTTVDTTDDLLGVAVWLPSDVPEAKDYDQRLAEATGRYLPRFQALDVAMHHSHPSDRPHEYLPFIAVQPEVWGCRLGSALLERHDALLDDQGIPAYLEAASPASARLYRRHGYQPINRLFGPTGSGPKLRPMWREPRTRQ